MIKDFSNIVPQIIKFIYSCGSYVYNCCFYLGRTVCQILHLTGTEKKVTDVANKAYTFTSSSSSLKPSVGNSSETLTVSKASLHQRKNPTVSSYNGIPTSTSFYKGKYFDICEINGSKFALFSKQITSGKTLSINLVDCNVVFLAPLQAEENICVKAISVIVLTTLHAKKGKSEINASGKVILLGGTVKSHLDNNISGDKGVFTLGIIKERFEMIFEQFKSGISSEKGPAIVDALMETFDAIQDPSAEDENENIEIAKVFEFFNIS